MQVGYFVCLPREEIGRTIRALEAYSGDFVLVGSRGGGQSAEGFELKFEATQ